ncbi:MAG: hypothetical protein ACXQTR_02585 [Candidatus Methanospirareceae archaeon]
MPKSKVVIPKDKNIDALVRKFKAGRINVKKFAKEIQELGHNPEFWLTPTQMAKYVRTGNDSREGFKYNCYTDKKRGMFFQSVIKKAILKAIDFAHMALQKNYDKNIFVFDDERLQKLDSFAEYIISKYYSDIRSARGYKDVFMRKCKEIKLGLNKEDIYYRARDFATINEFVIWMQENYPDGIPLTDGEKRNLIEWQ